MVESSRKPLDTSQINVEPPHHPFSSTRSLGSIDICREASPEWGVCLMWFCLRQPLVTLAFPFVLPFCVFHAYVTEHCDAEQQVNFLRGSISSPAKPLCNLYITVPKKDAQYT